MSSKGYLVERELIYLSRYDITIQDIKLANSLWTNEGLYTGRILRIPVVESGMLYFILSRGIQEIFLAPI